MEALNGEKTTSALYSPFTAPGCLISSPGGLCLGGGLQRRRLRDAGGRGRADGPGRLAAPRRPRAAEAPGPGRRFAERKA